MSWTLPRVVVPDFGATMDAAQAYKQNALAEMLAQSKVQQDQSYSQVLQQNSAGLSSNDPVTYRNALVALARSGTKGAELAIPLLQKERDNAWMDTAASGAAGSPFTVQGGGSLPDPIPNGPGSHTPIRAPVGVKASAPLKAGGTTAADVPAAYLPFYQRAAAKYGVPVDLLIAQGSRESDFNPNAVGGAGEIGLGQIHPKTAADPGYGVPPISAADARDPEKAIDFQARYMAARAKAAGVDFSTPEGQNAALRLYNGGGDPRYVQNVRDRMPGQGAGGDDQRDPAALRQMATQIRATGRPGADAAAANLEQQASAVEFRRTTGIDMAQVERARAAAARGSQSAATWLRLIEPQLKREAPNYSFQNIGGTLYAVNPQNPAERKALGPAGENNETVTVPDPGSPTGYRYMSRADAIRTSAAAPPPSSLVTVDNKGRSAFDEADGKTMADRANTITTQATKAGQTLSRLGRVENILERIQTGMGANQKTTVGNLAQQLGVPDEVLNNLGLSKDQTAAGEELRSLSSQMLTGMLGSGGFPTNNFSNADREALERALPNIANTPAGNKAILDVLRASAKRDIEINRAWIDWQKKSGRSMESYAEFERTRLDEILSRDVLGPILEKAPKVSGPAQPAPSQPAPGAPSAEPGSAQPGQAVAAPSTSEEYGKLPSGTLFRAPDGSVRRKP